MTERACKNCEYWDDELTVEIGMCRKYAPGRDWKDAYRTLELKNRISCTVVFPYWPPTHATDHCGEFRQREQTAEEKGEQQ